MNPLQSAGSAPWLAALRRYLAATTAGHLAWEFAQMPLYTIWANGTTRDIVLAALHCTAGDLLIALASLVASLLLVGDARWPAMRFQAVAWLAVSFGLVYTAFSEWLNVAVRASWAYSDLMPVLSLGPVDLGLAPMLQWIVIPALSLRAARGAR